MTLLLRSSSTDKEADREQRQPPSQAKTASESAIGKAAAIHGPIYGMKRSTTAKAPQSTAFGTPMK